MADSDIALVRPPRKDAKAYRRWHYLANREKVLRQCKEWVSKNAERAARNRRQYQKTHPEAFRKSHNKWRERNKDHEALRYARYRAEHHEELKEKERNRARNRYAECKEELLKRNKKWRDRNPEYILHQSQKRRALKKLATVNQRQILAWMKSVRSKPTAQCYYCSTVVSVRSIHFDHIIGLSKGGPHCVENLCVSCADCNLAKGGKPIRFWTKVGQQMLEL